jgi:Fe2+ transport system protein B
MANVQKHLSTNGRDVELMDLPGVSGLTSPTIDRKRDDKVFLLL